MFDGFRARGRRAAWLLLGFAAITWSVAVAGMYGIERAWLLVRPVQESAGGPVDPLFRFRMPGIIRPPTVGAGESTIRPNEEVIGVEVDGRARAYRLDAFLDRSRHVVNDVVGDAPVTVTYCNLNQCIRAYTGRRATGPLDVSIAGLYEADQMVLEVDGKSYFQHSGAPLERGAGPASIPLERLSPARTTWGEWKRRHPSTDAYEGAR